MRMQKISALMAGLLLSASGFAGTVTINTSDNLVGQYTLSDSGLYAYSYDYELGNVNYQTTTFANVLGTFQNIASGQWFQTTQYIATTSYDRYFQEAHVTEQTTQVLLASVAGDQWVELSIDNTGVPMGFSGYVTGVSGSKLSPRGNKQYITPAVSFSADGSGFSSVAPYLTNYNNGLVDFYPEKKSVEQVTLLAEATDGGSLSLLQISLSQTTFSEPVHTRISYISNQWTEDVLIFAPVPEPETYAMLLAGLGLMSAVARRRKNKANA